MPSSFYLDYLIEQEVKSLDKERRIQLPEPTFLPIHLTGGIGDVIMSVDMIEDLSKRYQVAVYTKYIDVYRYFAGNKISSFQDHPNYTWLLRVDHVAKYHFEVGFSDFVLDQHKELYQKHRKLLMTDSKLSSILTTHSDKYILAALHAKSLGLDRREFPIYSMGIDPIPYTVLPRKKPKDIITLHDGYDSANLNAVSGRATKQWKWEHWNELVKNIKKLYPWYRILQLGTLTSRPIDGVDECLINKTTITQALDIISESALHIDGDSGLVHAATKMSVPCVVIWGPTPPDFFGYKQNINIRSNACSQSCYGLKKNWMDKCPIGYSSPKCMDETLPETILKNIQNVLI